MFPQESEWIRQALQDLPLEPGARAVDVGSSTTWAREIAQPFVNDNVVAPLSERGVAISHLDIKADEGVDFVCDITDPSFDPERDAGGRYDLVLCCNMLVAVSDLERAVRSVVSMAAPGGYVLVTACSNYRLTSDPGDNELRPSPAELEAMLQEWGGVALEPVATGDLRIRSAHDYVNGIKWPSSVRIRGRFHRVPGVFDVVRYFVPPLRWRHTCVLMHVSGDRVAAVGAP